jgi:hypothetical protein
VECAPKMRHGRVGTQWRKETQSVHEKERIAHATAD